MNDLKIIGPFQTLIPLSGLSMRGPLKDAELQPLKNVGIVIKGGKILMIGQFSKCIDQFRSQNPSIEKIEEEVIGLPGFIDAHTHICFAGSRAKDFAMRNAGATYLEIAKSGGGIWDTVQKTRAATLEDLVTGISRRAKIHFAKGVTTIEVKSGYGLSVEEELKMLKAIHACNEKLDIDLIPTCLAAHIFPRDYDGNIFDYIAEISANLLPVLKTENLAQRIDAFIEEEAFNAANITPYFNKAKELNLDIVVHADQFSPGGSELAVEFGALSADHLESSAEREIIMLAKSDVVATALPGASIGLGVPFTPCRKILDHGGILCIASDWNPGSAPMGDLLTQASILATYEHLTNAEVFAGLTFRAAKALNLKDRGTLEQNKWADIIAFPGNDFREILYHQGQLKPSIVWKKGKIIKN